MQSCSKIKLLCSKENLTTRCNGSVGEGYLSQHGQDKESLRRRKLLRSSTESKVIRRKRMEPKETPPLKDESRGLYKGLGRNRKKCKRRDFQSRWQHR